MGEWLCRLSAKAVLNKNGWQVLHKTNSMTYEHLDAHTQTRNLK